VFSVLSRLVTWVTAAPVKRPEMAATGEAALSVVVAAVVVNAAAVVVVVAAAMEAVVVAAAGMAVVVTAAGVTVVVAATGAAVVVAATGVAVFVTAAMLAASLGATVATAVVRPVSEAMSARPVLTIDAALVVEVVVVAEEVSAACADRVVMEETEAVVAASREANMVSPFRNLPLLVRRKRPVGGGCWCRSAWALNARTSLVCRNTVSLLRLSRGHVSVSSSFCPHGPVTGAISEERRSFLKKRTKKLLSMKHRANG
jgi:hypothetical protein